MPVGDSSTSPISTVTSSWYWVTAPVPVSCTKIHRLMLKSSGSASKSSAVPLYTSSPLSELKVNSSQSGPDTNTVTISSSPFSMVATIVPAPPFSGRVSVSVVPSTSSPDIVIAMRVPPFASRQGREL